MTSQCPLCHSISGHFMGCPFSKPPINRHAPATQEEIKAAVEKMIRENPELFASYKPKGVKDE